MFAEHLSAHQAKASLPVVINGLDYYDMFKSRIIWRKVPPKHRALIECHVLAR
jgi:hypothetical protein